MRIHWQLIWCTNGCSAPSQKVTPRRHAKWLPFVKWLISSVIVVGAKCPSWPQNEAKPMTAIQTRNYREWEIIRSPPFSCTLDIHIWHTCNEFRHDTASRQSHNLVLKVDGDDLNTVASSYQTFCDTDIVRQWHNSVNWQIPFGMSWGIAAGNVGQSAWSGPLTCRNVFCPVLINVHAGWASTDSF